jgi:anti-sigma factor RsiW
MMTCREFAEFLGDYLSGDLSVDVRSSFDRHLALCVNCQRYLAHYRETAVLGRAAFDDVSAAVPPDVPEDLIAAIVAARADRLV